MSPCDTFLVNGPADKFLSSLTDTTVEREYPLEVSIVIPCLNEIDTIATCVSKALRALEQSGVAGEVIVSDNGSTDGSLEGLKELGASVVIVPDRGYGRCLTGGIKASTGRYIVIGDGDDSYDFGELTKFLPKFREGDELVLGCRLPSGGGMVMPNAMPLSHLLIGNPLFSWMARCCFKVPVHDINCGLRGLSRELFDRLSLRQPGMEFAVEMVLKAADLGARISEVPIVLHRDGRKNSKPHLRTVRDGWRTLRVYFKVLSGRLFQRPSRLMERGG